jgi:hypothetical protein
MAILNEQTLQPISTLREAPLNGAPSSHDYNDTVREALADSATLYNFVNEIVIALVNSMDASALPAVGIQGSTVYSDSADNSALFFDSLEQQPLTIAQSLRILNSTLSTYSQQLLDLGINVSALQARLSSTNQNDIALALQNIINSLNTLSTQINTNQGQVDNVHTYLSGAQKVRAATSPGIPAGGTEVVLVTWPLPFIADPTSYVVNYAMEDNDGYLTITSFSYLSDGTGIYVRVLNTDNSGVHNGFVHATGLGPNT